MKTNFSVNTHNPTNVMNPIRLTPVLLVLILLAACSEDPVTSNTPMAEVGELIALVNGISYKSDIDTASTYAEYSNGSGGASLRIKGGKRWGGSRDSVRSEEISIELTGVSGTGQISLNDQQLASYVKFERAIPPAYPEYELFKTTDQHIGTITITKLDTVAHLVSGTFRFDAKQEDSTRTIKVLDGSFTDLFIKMQ
jgi:hypothetical protein